MRVTGSSGWRESSQGHREGKVEDATEAEFVATGRGMAWNEVMLTLEQERERARAAFSAFVDPPDAAVALFTEEAFGHYEEHAAEIRAFGA